MFKHFLVPTDGSELSQHAVRAAIELATTVGASITVYHATQNYPVSPFAEYVPADVLSPDEFDQRQAERAQAIVSEVKALADAAGVACDTHYAVADSPWQGIVKAALDKDCDLIFMSSHGRRGIAAVMLGSETNRVLTHCHIPVLVYREYEGK